MPLWPNANALENIGKIENIENIRKEKVPNFGEIFAFFQEKNHIFPKF